MRDWALPLLRCLACGDGPLQPSGRGVGCAACGHEYESTEGVTDFLYELHPVAAKELEAVRRRDAEGVAPKEWIEDILTRLAADELTSEDLEASEYVCNVYGARRLVAELLAKRPIEEDARVVELGADLCWTSAALLDEGCRVIAFDITEHLRLAPNGDDEALCRIQADMNRLPVRDGAVDVVWATACVHHSWSLARTLDEIVRVLRPGGRLYLCAEPMPSYVQWLVGGDFGADERDEGINETWIPRRRWLAACRSAGLEPELLLPRMGRQRLERKMAERRIPRFLAPLVGWLLSRFHLSPHLVAEKPLPDQP